MANTNLSIPTLLHVLTANAPLVQGITMVSEVSMQQVEALAGLETLCQQTTASVQTMTAKALARGRTRLADALIKVLCSLGLKC